jgi:hypothetical protein
VKSLSKYKFKTDEKFKELAKALTETMMDKERRARGSKLFEGINEKTKIGIKKWLHKYMKKKGFKHKSSVAKKHGHKRKSKSEHRKDSSSRKEHKRRSKESKEVEKTRQSQSDQKESHSTSDKNTIELST